MAQLELARFEYKNKVPKAFRRLGCPAFDLKLGKQRGFDEATNKIVVVIGKVPTVDLMAGKILGDPISLSTMSNLLYQTEKWARTIGKIKQGKYSFINFNYFKTYHLGDEAFTASLQENTKRVLAYIKEVKPTTVLIMGDEAAEAILGSEIDYVINKRGWVHELKGFDCKFVSAIEWDTVNPNPKDSMRMQVDMSNLMGYSSRKLAHGLLGYHPFSLAKIKPKYKLINSIKKFDKCMKHLYKSRVVAVDTETTGLEVIENKILMIQFATTIKFGYVIPIDHKDTPFTGKQLLYIKSKLKEYFEQKVVYTGIDTKCLVTQNGAFDLRIIRACLKVPCIYFPVWDTMAGEFCFHPDTLVETEFGKQKIKDIVNSDVPTRVWSYNHDTKTKELKPLIGKSTHYSTEDMLEIQHEQGSIKVTESHKIWSNTRGAYIEARDIKVGEDLELF